MAGVKLQWAQFGRVDSFNVYRSDTPFNFENLPEPIATEITQPEYWDATAERFKTYFYTVSAFIGTNENIAQDQISIFTINNDFVFEENERYTPPINTLVNFIW